MARWITVAACLLTLALSLLFVKDGREEVEENWLALADMQDCVSAIEAFQSREQIVFTPWLRTGLTRLKSLGVKMTYREKRYCTQFWPAHPDLVRPMSAFSVIRGIAIGIAAVAAPTVAVAGIKSLPL